MGHPFTSSAGTGAQEEDPSEALACLAQYAVSSGADPEKSNPKKEGQGFNSGTVPILSEPNPFMMHCDMLRLCTL